MQLPQPIQAQVVTNNIQSMATDNSLLKGNLPIAV
jgi:hypothetical protein